MGNPHKLIINLTHTHAIETGFEVSPSHQQGWGGLHESNNTQLRAKFVDFMGDKIPLPVTTLLSGER